MEVLKKVYFLIYPGVVCREKHGSQRGRKLIARYNELICDLGQGDALFIFPYPASYFFKMSLPNNEPWERFIDLVKSSPRVVTILYNDVVNDVGDIAETAHKVFQASLLAGYELPEEIESFVFGEHMLRIVLSAGQALNKSLLLEHKTKVLQDLCHYSSDEVGITNMKRYEKKYSRVECLILAS